MAIFPMYINNQYIYPLIEGWNLFRMHVLRATIYPFGILNCEHDQEQHREIELSGRTHSL